MAEQYPLGGLLPIEVNETGADSYPLLGMELTEPAPAGGGGGGGGAVTARRRVMVISSD